MWSRKAAAYAYAAGGAAYAGKPVPLLPSYAGTRAAGASLQAEKAESRTRGNNEVNKLSH